LELIEWWYKFRDVDKGRIIGIFEASTRFAPHFYCPLLILASSVGLRKTGRGQAPTTLRAMEVCWCWTCAGSWWRGLLGTEPVGVN
jgi:hypothetical protein